MILDFYWASGICYDNGITISLVLLIGFNVVQFQSSLSSLAVLPSPAVSVAQERQTGPPLISTTSTMSLPSPTQVPTSSCNCP
uniref:Uncharacterized protein n=1 Tax=Amphimedon queenslandica TaxID=400682 RepID=A0A1X7VDZ5_AMPQE